jgi:chromosomal replication initiation ATPase DnaA
MLALTESGLRTHYRDVHKRLMGTPSYVYAYEIDRDSRYVIDDTIVDMMRACLDEPRRATTQKAIVNLIIRACCSKFGIHLDKFLSECRYRPHPTARAVATYLACELTTEPNLSFIGRIMRRDHSTIIHNRLRVMRHLAEYENGDPLSPEGQRIVDGVKAVSEKIKGQIPNDRTDRP